nr:zinc finger, CCHC-type, retrotransposon Gag domain protein [Tanacetum cinerariifolium]
MVNTRTDADLSAAVQTPYRHCFPRFARSSVRVLDRRMLVEIPHRLLFILGLNALISKSLIPLRMRQLLWTRRIGIFDVMGCEDAFKTRLAVYKFEGNALAWCKAYKQAKGSDAWLITVTWADFKKLFFLQFFPRAEQERLKRKYHSIRQTNTETRTEFMQRFLRLAGFLGAAAGTEEEQAKNFQWGLRRSTLNHLMCMSYTDVAQVANAVHNYKILHERDDDDTERPDKRQKSGDRHQPTSQQSSHRNHGQNNDRHGSDRRGVISPTDLPIMIPSSPGVPLRATPTQFALHVDADIQESVVELLVLASSVVKLAIYRKIARRTPYAIPQLSMLYMFCSFRHNLYSSCISFHVLYDSPSVHTLCMFLIRGVDVFFRLSRLFQTFKTLCLLNYALMIRHDYDLTSSLRRGALHAQSISSGT